MDLPMRKAAVLKTVVELYIRTNEPVGSKAVVQQLDTAVSSATVRSEMAELSSLGLLTQPHTSAGRVPTGRAFRLYVDKLMRCRTLEEQDKREIDETLHRCGDPERLMDTAARMLAENTGYAAITTTPFEQDVCLKRLEIMPLSPRSAALWMMTSSGALRSRVCRFERDVTMAPLTQIQQLLCERYLDAPLSQVTRSGVQSLLAACGENGLLYAPLLSGFYELAEASAETEVLLDGQLNLLRQPDYAPDAARSLLHFLSQRDQLVQMMRVQTEGVRVLLGEESLRPELAGTSVIVAPYAGGKAVGAIGLVGPLRMDYADAIPRMQYLSHAVGRLLRELTVD